MILYCITNLVNNKKYIGVTTKSLRHRIITHKNTINSKRKKNYPLYSSIRKHGWDKFKFEEILCCFNLKDLEYFEIYFIKECKTTNRDFGYNLASGGSVNIPNEYARKKSSELMKKLWKETPEIFDNCRKVNSELGKIRMKGNNLFKSLTNEQKELARVNRKGKYTGSQNHNYGKPGFMKGRKFTDEHKLKISKALQNNSNTKTYGEHHNSKKIRCIETKEIFNSVSEAKLKYRKGNIYKAAITGRTSSGFHWEYIKDTANG